MLRRKQQENTVQASSFERWALCRDHEATALSYYAMTEWAKHIIDDIEPEEAEYIAVDFGFRDATAVSIHTINEEKAQQHETRKRWAHMVQSIVNFR